MSEGDRYRKSEFHYKHLFTVIKTHTHIRSLIVFVGVPTNRCQIFWLFSLKLKFIFTQFFLWLCFLNAPNREIVPLLRVPLFYSYTTNVLICMTVWWWLTFIIWIWIQLFVIARYLRNNWCCVHLNICLDTLDENYYNPKQC